MDTSIQCFEHSNCEHNILYCSCIDCWKHDAQCQYQFQSEGTPLGMARSDSGSSTLASDYQSPRPPNIHCTEALHSPISPHESRPNYTELTGPLTRDTQNRDSGTYISPPSGALASTRFDFPNIATPEWEYYIRAAFKHLQPTATEDTINKHLQSAIGSLPTRSGMDSDRNTTSTTTDIRNQLNRGCLISDTSESDNEPTTISTSKPTKSMGETSKCHPDSSSPRKRRSSGSHYEQETQSDTCNSTQSPKRAKTHISESDNETTYTITESDGDNGIGGRGTSEYGNINRAFFTTVLHKSNQITDWKKRKSIRRLRAPNFTTFDHGDHYHIIYSSHAKGGNSSKQRTTIGRYLGATSAGFTELNAACQRIYNLDGYILYLIRYGNETLNQYGDINNETANAIKKCFEKHFRNRDPNEILIDSKCKFYIEQKKKSTRIGSEKRKNIVDIIEELIKKHKIKTMSQWKLRVPEDIKLQLLKEYGLGVDTYVNRQIQYKKQNKTGHNKTMSLTTYMIQHMQDILRTHTDNLFFKTMEWIKFMLQENKINLIEFLAWAEIIKTKRYNKVNAIVLQGPTNAGKTMILHTLYKDFKATTVPRQNDNSQFHLDQLPTAAAVLFEEILLTPVNVGVWKLLLEGQSTVNTDIKQGDKESIDRIPILISSAKDIANNVDIEEKLQVNQRIKKFIFIKTLHHRDEIYTLTPELMAARIPKPPGLVTTKHWAFLYNLHADEIQKYIDEQDRSFVVERDAIEIPWQLLNVQQIQARMRWTLMKEENEPSEPSTPNLTEEDQEEITKA